MTINHNLVTHFYVGLTIYLPTHMQTFTKIGQHLAMLW